MTPNVLINLVLIKKRRVIYHCQRVLGWELFTVCPLSKGIILFPLSGALWTFLRGVGYPLKSPHSCILPSGLLSITSKLLPWQFCVDTDGHLIAILQETSIEIRWTVFILSFRTICCFITQSFSFFSRIAAWMKELSTVGKKSNYVIRLFET